MYEHLLGLQGIVIPQCYGYYRRTINLQDYVVKPWNPRCKFPRTRDDLDIFDMPNTCASLNVLLLEYVGERITKGPSTSEEELRTMPGHMYDELSHLGVSDCDLWVENILHVKTPVDDSGPRSPLHEQRYSYRFIDLESAEVQNKPSEYFMRMETKGVELDKIIRYVVQSWKDYPGSRGAGGRG
ncbi:hypothetical protein C8Q72DRAFT_650396 [Fomitopsis betulina]|nr:hypothetical protein C8Q72DRAFT_650396 [Fomitopsis betulina]